MKSALVLYTNGTEDIEATAALDILHRGGVKVVTAAVTNDGSRMVELAHSSVIVCNLTFEDVTDDYDLIVIPGGPGTINFAKCPALIEKLQKQLDRGALIGAICAAPGVVLYAQGIIDENTTATCYPGCECGKHFSTKGVCVSENDKIITARSPQYAIEFGLKMLEYLVDKETADRVASSILYKPSL